MHIFRNRLTHEYPNVSDAVVWGIAARDVPILRSECAALLRALDEAGGSS